MTPHDRKAFVEVVAGFAELKGKVLSAPAFELFWRALQHWTIDEFRAAANHLVRHCEFFPTPKDFEDLRRAGRLTAGEAWQRALTHAAGAYRSQPSCGADLVDRVVAMLGGYVVIGMCDLAKLGFLERRFAEHYQELRDSSEIRAALPGIVERPMLTRSESTAPGPRSVGQCLTAPDRPEPAE